MSVEPPESRTSWRDQSSARVVERLLKRGVIQEQQGFLRLSDEFIAMTGKYHARISRQTPSSPPNTVRRLALGAAALTMAGPLSVLEMAEVFAVLASFYAFLREDLNRLGAK